MDPQFHLQWPESAEDTHRSVVVLPRDNKPTCQFQRGLPATVSKMTFNSFGEVRLGMMVLLWRDF